jgi:hypothetical protein
MSRTMKPTPGPWTTASDRGYGHYNGVQITDNRTGLVLAVAIGDVPELHAPANARLIAAAPDLLATLIKVRDSFIYADDHSDTAVMTEADNHHFDEVCAAISKAAT